MSNAKERVQKFCERWKDQQGFWHIIRTFYDLSADHEMALTVTDVQAVLEENAELLAALKHLLSVSKAFHRETDKLSWLAVTEAERIIAKAEGTGK